MGRTVPGGGLDRAAQRAGTQWLHPRTSDRGRSTQQPLRGATVRFGSQSTQTRARRQLSPHRGPGRHRQPPGDDDRLYARRAGRSRWRPARYSKWNVILSGQAVALSELVVVGYGEQRQGNVTGAVTNVTSGEFNTGRVVTPTELIQNKVAGVQVVENTEPGGKTSIRIRGRNLDHREQRAALRHRRPAARNRRRWRGEHRTGPAQFPQPR